MSYGTVTEGIFIKDGQYLSFTGSGAITLGNVVHLQSDGTVVKCSAGELGIGVATGGNRQARTSTDDVIADGDKVTVCTRGVVNVYTDTSAITIGAFVAPGASGVVTLAATQTAGTGLGIALEANSSAAATIKVKLLRG